MKRRKRWMTILLLFICLFVWIPFLLMASAALMPEDELYWRYLSVLGLGQDRVRAALFPSYPSAGALTELLFHSPGFFVMFWNSCIQLFPMLLGQLIVGAPAAWAFARFNFPGRRWLFGTYILLMVLPFQITQVSNYLVLDRMGLLNSHLALIVPGIWAALPVFVMERMFETVPKALLEAACLDGAGEFYTFSHIGLPLGYPGIVTALMLSFVDGWNSLEQPLTYLKDKHLWPVALYLPDIAADKAAVAFAAALVTCMLPVLIYFNAQEELEQGGCGFRDKTVIPFSWYRNFYRIVKEKERRERMQERHMPVKRWLLSGFFLFMLACTGISRIYDSVTVPKVRTTAAKQKTVETLIEGNGTVKVKEKHHYPVSAGLRLAQAVVEPGSEVQEGDLLFRYDLDSIKEKKEDLLTELEQIEINIRKEQIAQENYEGMSQTELARWELELAMRELGEKQAELEEEWGKHDEELARFAQEYEDGLARLNDDLWQQQDRNWEHAERELENIKNSRDREIRAAQRNIDELVDELDKLPEEDEEGRRKMERELQGAREDMDVLRAAWKEQMESAQAQMELLEDQEERLHAGRTDAQESKKKSYEEAVRQEMAKIEEAQKGVRAYEKAVENAEWQLLTAQKQEEAAQLSQDQKQRISALTIRGMELEKREKNRQLSRIAALERSGGAVFAVENGTVADMELIAGKTTSGEEIVSLAVGENQFEAVFLKEEQNLAKGDKIEISIPGTPRKKEAVISRINLMGDKEGVFQADLEDSELALGSVTSYHCAKQTDIFAKVIPLEGLRKDMKGYYCLVARERQTILGEEFRAERVNLELLYQGSREAAVEGSIFAEDAVIIGENQSISEGSRVRPIG